MRLQNKTIAITRNERDAAEFSKLINAEGGRVIALPTIELIPADSKIVVKFISEIKKKKHDYCAFMSPRAVNVLFELAEGMKMTDKIVSALNSTNIIAVGPNTSEQLAKYGIKVKMIPEKYSSVGLVELLSKKEARGKKIIIPRSGLANEFAAKALKDVGMQVDEIFLYSVKPALPTKIWHDFASLLKGKKIDAIVFTSASSVQAFFEIMDQMSKISILNAMAISIGPFTSVELQKKYVKYIEADEHTIKGTFDVLKKIADQNKS